MADPVLLEMLCSRPVEINGLFEERHLVGDCLPRDSVGLFLRNRRVVLPLLAEIRELPPVDPAVGARLPVERGQIDPTDRWAVRVVSTATVSIERHTVAVRGGAEGVLRDVARDVLVAELGVGRWRECVRRDAAEPVDIVVEQKDVVVVLPGAAALAAVASKTDLPHDRGQPFAEIGLECCELGLERADLPVEQWSQPCCSGLETIAALC